MLSHDFLDRLPVAVLYGVASVVLVSLVLSRLAEAREDFARLLGPLGKWLRLRAQRRRMFAQREWYDAELGVLRRQIATLDEVVKKLEDAEHAHAGRRDMTAAYLQADAEWHVEAAVVAAEKRLRLPARLTYTEFCRRYRADLKRSEKS